MTSPAVANLVPPDWPIELAQIAAMPLAEFRKGVAGETFAMLAVDCRPADGFIAMSMLLEAEAAKDPAIASPSRTSAWLHEGIERKTGMWRLAAGVERVMQETWHCAPEENRPAIGEAFIAACGQAMRSERVREELEKFQRTPGFAIEGPPRL